jgi:hypothetical protein
VSVARTTAFARGASKLGILVGKMRVKLYIRLGLMKDNMTYLRMDQPRLADSTKTKISGFIESMAADWDIFTNPFMPNVLRLHQSKWLEADSTLEVSIDVNANMIPTASGGNVTPYDKYMTKDDMVKFILYKFIYDDLMRKVPDTYLYYLRTHHLGKTAFVPVVLDGAVAW